MNRREFLRIASLVASASALAGCRPAYRAIGGPVEARSPGAGRLLSDFEEAVLRRLTYGPRQAERLRVAEIGLPAWIEEQLAPETIDDAPLDWRLRAIDILDMSADDLYNRGERLFDGFDMTGILEDLRAATLLRRVYSRRQVYEMMAEFWTDHFNISMDKEDVWYLKPVDDRDVIRPHALGNFRDLVQASAHSPAMLTYLDNQANLVGAPNENYARELMELHTLGVDGGYTQQDVMALARCLTGWTVKARFWRGAFEFNPDFHDNSVKTVLGLRIEANGISEAETVIDHLAEQPATARFLAAKLARRFIADDPPAAIIERTAETFLATRGEIRSTLRTLLLDGLLQSDAALAPKFRRPADFTTAALRALNAETDGYGGDSLAFSRALTSLGQAPFQWPTPDGPPDTAPEWMGNLLPRWKFSLALALGEIAGTEYDLRALIDPDQVDSLEAGILSLWTELFGLPAPAGAAADLADAIRPVSPAGPAETARAVIAGMLASPAFQWR